MPSRCKKTNNSASLSMNQNACEQSVTSRIETIGNSIIEKLKGSERNHLKQQLSTSGVFNRTTITDSAVSPLNRSLKRVLDNLYAFDCYNQRQYRTVGIGDNDINRNIPNVSENKSELLTVSERRTRRVDVHESSPMVEKKTTKTLNSPPRTMCTRSSKFNTNQEQIDHVLPNRIRKRPSSSTNNIDEQTPIVANQTTEKSTRENMSRVKTVRQKEQSSVPDTTNNF